VLARRAEEPARQETMKLKKILFIGGSLNQTRIAHAVYGHLSEDYEARFSPYYCDGFLRVLQQKRPPSTSASSGGSSATGRWPISGNTISRSTRAGGRGITIWSFTTTDLLIQKNIRNKPVILIQEGMTDPENMLFPSRPGPAAAALAGGDLDDRSVLRL